VYRALKSLEAAQMVKSTDALGVRKQLKFALSVTEEGGRVLRGWLNAPAVHIRDLRTEFLVKLHLRELAGMKQMKFISLQRDALDQVLSRLLANPSRSAVAIWRREQARAVARFLDELAGEEAPSTNNKDDSFDHFKMKDSKKFTSKNSKKIQEVAEYIKEHAIAWAVEYEDERVIDEINILQATQSAMHKAIKSVIRQLQIKESEVGLDPNFNNLLLLIDGNYFKQLTILNQGKTKLVTVNYETVEGGDNKFTAIAAASILAKTERDKYIDDLCKENPELIDRYGIDSNKGYGSKVHMDGIKKYGITKWHRRTFGLCKNYV
jgi:ribonuclease HII